jgi:LysM repeat protein
LEKKVSHLEKTLEKAAADLRTLSTSANQALNKIQVLEQDLSSHEKRLEEVSKLKGTLTSISKAISQKPNSDAPANTKSYRVKAGDSLEKIARAHHTSADLIKKINNISNDKIIVGQELRIPDDSQ